MPATAGLAATQCCVVLVRTAGPVNLGLVARLCGNLGIDDLRLVTPLCDGDSEDARRFANKARHRLQRAPRFADLATAVADCQQVLGSSARPRGLETVAELGPAAVPAWHARRGGGRLALVFGNEAHGLSDDELARCHAFLHLPMPGDYPSYNLSHAVALACWSVLGIGRGAPVDDEASAAVGAVTDSLQLAAARAAERELDGPDGASAPAASAAEREALANYWLGTLDRFGLFADEPVASADGRRAGWQRRFRTWLSGCPLSTEQLGALRGALARCNQHAFGDKAPEMAANGRAPGPGASRDER